MRNKLFKFVKGDIIRHQEGQQKYIFISYTSVGWAMTDVYSEQIEVNWGDNSLWQKTSDKWEIVRTIESILDACSISITITPRFMSLIDTAEDNRIITQIDNVRFQDRSDHKNYKRKVDALYEQYYQLRDMWLHTFYAAALFTPQLV